MSLPYVTVDVFTTTKFAGNPLAVIRLPSTVTLTQAQKQQIAKEFNYCETVFVHPPDTDSTALPTWPIDIFTITTELPFAGHPVIGTACTLLATAEPTKALTQGTLLTKAGPIPLTYDVSTRQAHASIPHNIRIHAATLPDHALSALQPNLGAYPRASPIVSIVPGMTFALVRLESLAELACVVTTTLDVDIARDEGWDWGIVGLYFYVCLPAAAAAAAAAATAVDEGGARGIRARMIQRIVGEDPATGSAACALAAYLAVQGPSGEEGGLVEFEIAQGVEMGRRSDIAVQVRLGPGRDREGEQRVEEIRLGGSSVQVMEGTLRL